jgi:hypothetical protein
VLANLAPLISLYARITIYTLPRILPWLDSSRQQCSAWTAAAGRRAAAGACLSYGIGCQSSLRLVFEVSATLQLSCLATVSAVRQHLDLIVLATQGRPSWRRFAVSRNSAITIISTARPRRKNKLPYWIQGASSLSRNIYQTAWSHRQG